VKRTLIPGREREERAIDAPKIGRPSRDEVRQRQVDIILERHADGEPLVDICTELGLRPAVFRGWCRNDPGLAEDWRAVRADYVDALFDKLASVTAQLAASGTIDADDKAANARVNSLKAAQDGFKHITARLKPSAYGDNKATGPGMTVIFNTDLPIGPGQSPGASVDGDFTIVLPAAQKVTGLLTGHGERDGR
jgi:hypothetical protein